MYSNNKDAILIENWQVSAKVGCSDAERADFQTIVISIQAVLISNQASQTDNLVDTCDYVKLSNRVSKMLENRKFNLLESLSDHVCQIALSFDAVEQVTVTAKKPNIISTADYVGVQVTRHRSAQTGIL